MSVDKFFIILLGVCFVIMFFLLIFMLIDLVVTVIDFSVFC